MASLPLLVVYRQTSSLAVAVISLLVRPSTMVVIALMNHSKEGKVFGRKSCKQRLVTLVYSTNDLKRKRDDNGR